MNFSPSNSGVLMKVGDVVALDRDPKDDCVGVQAHGDGEGVELIFEGTLTIGLMPLKASPGADTMPLEPDGRFCYLLDAEGVSHVQVRLGAISSGSVSIALFSGKAEVMKQAAKPAPSGGAEPKAVKLARATPPPATGFRNHESGGKFYAIDNATGQSSEAFATPKERDAWVMVQTSKTVVVKGEAPKAEHREHGHREQQPAKKN